MPSFFFCFLEIVVTKRCYRLNFLRTTYHKPTTTSFAPFFKMLACSIANFLLLSSSLSHWTEKNPKPVGKCIVEWNHNNLILFLTPKNKHFFVYKRTKRTYSIKKAIHVLHFKKPRKKVTSLPPHTEETSHSMSRRRRRHIHTKPRRVNGLCYAKRRNKKKTKLQVCCWKRPKLI